MSQEVRTVVGQVSPRLAELTGGAAGPLRVEVIGQRAEFERRLRGMGAPSWASGVAVPGRGLIVLRSPGLLTQPGEFRSVLIHELTHIYLAAALGRTPPPLWLEEGLAMYAAGEGGWSISGVMSRGVLLGGLLPFDELVYNFPAKRTQAALAYAQSYYFVSYLLVHYGPESIKALLKELRKGHELTRALKVVTGHSLAQVQADFAADMDSRFSWLALLTAAGAVWALIALLAAVGLVVRRRAHLRARRLMFTPAEPEEEGAGDGRRWPPPKGPGRPLRKVGLEPEIPEIDGAGSSEDRTGGGQGDAEGGGQGDQRLR